MESTPAHDHTTVPQPVVQAYTVRMWKAEPQSQVPLTPGQCSSFPCILWFSRSYGRRRLNAEEQGALIWLLPCLWMLTWAQNTNLFSLCSKNSVSMEKKVTWSWKTHVQTVHTAG